MKGVHHTLRSAVSAAALLLMVATGAQAETTFPKPTPDFRGAVSFSAGSPAVPLLAGSEVTATGQNFAPGQQVTLMRGATVLATGTADQEGKLSVSFTLPEDAATGQHPIIVLGDNPSATVLQTLKISPTIPLSGAEKFDVVSAKATRGLYQAAYSPASKAVFVAAAVGRPPVKDSELLKFDPETLEIIARVTPAEAPARPDGTPGGVFAVYGVAVDDANGHVWTTNTRQDTIAVYNQSDLSLVKQFEPGAAPHARDIVIDDKDSRAYISVANSNEVRVFDTKTLEPLETVKIASGVRGKSFTSMSLAYDAEAGKLYTVSLSTPEAAVIDAASGKVERIIPLPGTASASGVAVVPEVNRLYVVSQGSDNLVVVDLANDSIIADVPVGAGALNVEYEPVSKQLFVANRGSATIAVLDLDGNLVANLDAGNLPNHVSADGAGTIWAVNKSVGEDDPKGDLLWRIRAAN